MEECYEEMREHLKEYIVDLHDYKEITTIGKGAFGKVYLAKNLKTDKKFAIKELLFEHLEGRQLKLFCREVQILAKCHNLFLLPFRGFTLNFPYSIVTEYITNGSLYEALRHRPKAPSLSPTHKTIIALGIANGMCHLHELNIIHRDLKSLNILLDENYYPKICDFGIARFKAESNQPVTQQIGTPHWMAPELFLKNNYDSKVDVYAYAIILWEMITEKIPFMGLNPMQIMTAVCQNHIRPPLPTNISPRLEMLLNLCWAQSPQERPDFKTIYQLFKEKKVYFDGTDFNEVDKVIKCVEKAELSQKIQKGISLPEADEEIQLSADDLATNNESKSDFGILEKYTNNASFKPILGKLLNGIDDTNISDFYKIGERIINKLAGDNLQALITSIHTVISRNRDYFDSFLESNLFKKLPWNNSGCFQVFYQLLVSILQIQPSSVNLNQMRSIYSGSFAQYPQLVVNLFYLISQDFDESYSANKIIEFMFEHENSCISLAGPVFLSLIWNLLMNHEDVYDRYFDHLKNILLLSFHDSNIETIQMAYRIVAKFFDESFVPPQISLHLKDPSLIRDAIIVMNKSKTFSMTKDTISTLLKNLEHKYVYEYIMKIVVNYGDLIFALCELWITNTDPSKSLHILLKILDSRRLSPSEDQAKLILSMFIENLKADNPPLSIISNILRKMDINSAMKHVFEHSLFIAQFADSVIKKPNNENVLSCLSLMNLFSANYIVNHFVKLFPKVQDLIEKDDILKFLSLSILLKTQQSDQVKMQLLQLGFINTFVSKIQTNENRQYGKVFEQLRI